MRVLIIVSLILSQTLGQDGSWCDSDECYAKHHELITRYVDQFGPFCELTENLKQLNESLTNLKNELKLVPNNSWIDDIQTSKKAAKKIKDNLPTEADVQRIQKQVEEWLDFIKKVNKTKTEILSIPKKTAQEIRLIESLLQDEKDEGCLKQFDEELAKFLEALATFLKFEDFASEMKELLKEADNNSKRAHDIVDNAKEILKKGEDLKKIQELARKTLIEAEKLEEIKKQISGLMTNQQDDVGQLIKRFKADFKKLIEKYKTSKNEVLLDDLDSTYDELNELTGGVPIDISKEAEDIKAYVDCMDCYYEFLRKCGRDKELSVQCSQKILECQNI